MASEEDEMLILIQKDMLGRFVFNTQSNIFTLIKVINQNYFLIIRWIRYSFFNWKNRFS